MSAFTTEERRYIVEEYESGTKIKEIADHLERRYQTIRSAVHSKWYKELKVEVDKFQEQVETPNVEPEELVEENGSSTESGDPITDHITDSVVDEVEEVTKEHDEEDEESEEDETVEELNPVEDIPKEIAEMMDYEAMDEAFAGDGMDSPIPF